MTRISLSSNWAVHAETRVELMASRSEIWAVIQRLSRFISADPYHTRMTDLQGNRLDVIPPRGTAIRIGHGIGITWFNRLGTVIHVVPNNSIAFTDLSKRGRNAGFPHVYRYQLTQDKKDTCEINLTVRGRWSARWIPRHCVKAWLWWVMAQAQWSIRMHTAYEIDRMRKQQAPAHTNPERKAIA